MSIANLKEKIISIAQNNFSNDNSISKKIEVISSTFNATPAIIAKDLAIEGQLDSSGLVEIEGKVKGNIEYELLSVEDGACIDGQFKRV